MDKALVALPASVTTQTPPLLKIGCMTIGADPSDQRYHIIRHSKTGTAVVRFHVAVPMRAIREICEAFSKTVKKAFKTRKWNDGLQTFMIVAESLNRTYTSRHGNLVNAQIAAMRRAALNS